MIVFAYYPADPRVRREAEALVQAGFEVEVVCLRKERERAVELVNGVRVVRLPMTRRHGSAWRYMLQCSVFFAMTLGWVVARHWRCRFDVVHVHNMPDILVLAAIVPRITGAKIIVLDLHDPMPELFMAKHSCSASHPVTRVLIFLEKLSIACADIVLTPNLAFRDLFKSRGCASDKIQLVMNSPQESVFRRRSEVRGVDLPARDDFVVMYHGTVVQRHGLAMALRSMARLRGEIPGLRFEVYGDGEFVTEFLRLRRELGLDGLVRYHGHVPIERIAEAIEGIDVGIVPNERNPFTEANLPTRIFEYLWMGKPVIAPRTPGILDYFDDSSLHLFEPGDDRSLARAILRIYRDHEGTRAILRAGQEVCYQHRWELEAAHFTECIRAGLERRRRAEEDETRGEHRVEC
jgi:glycosyltransferase involved in cell wall biosynthesis